MLLEVIGIKLREALKVRLLDGLHGTSC